MASRTTVAFVGIVVAVGMPGTAVGAVDEALIGGMVSGTAPTQYSGVEGVAQCPPGERAVGGGIVPTGSTANIVLRVSGPLDETGTVAGTRDGDRPRAWYAAASNEGTGAASFRIFAVCAKAPATIEVKRFAMPIGEGKGASVACPGSKRAVGGGILQGGSYGGSFVRESGPTDATGSFRGTRDGDVPRRWRATMHNQGGSDYFKVAAVCVGKSKAKLEVTPRRLPADTVTRDVLVPCPGSKRAVGGGVLHNRGLRGYYSLGANGPLDETGSTTNTDVGDVPRYWEGGLNNIFGEPAARLKVAAICA
jgi:hypothetical protein